jgi:hypothetical protein
MLIKADGKMKMSPVPFVFVREVRDKFPDLCGSSLAALRGGVG